MTDVFLIFVGEITTQIEQDVKSHIEEVASARWLSAGRAYEVLARNVPDIRVFDPLKAQMAGKGVDLYFVPPERRRKTLLVADMDATIVTGETLDDLAELAGVGEEISMVTAAAMRGELDFEEALKLRVSQLKGLPEEFLDRAFAKVTLADGARTLVQVMRGAGATCVLVSGGFTYFTSRVGDLCGFSANHGNVLEIADGRLTGSVIAPVLDKQAKLDFLKSYADDLGIGLVETMVVGDGANDLPMLMAAGLGGGLGVGFRPKPLVQEQVENSIISGDLTSLLYMQGYTQEDIDSYTKN